MGRPIGLEDERALTRCRWVAIGCESSRGCGSEGGVCFLDSRVAASAPGPVTPNPGDPWTMGCPDPGNLRGPRPPLRWSAGAAVLPAALSGLNRSPLQPRPSALPTDRHRSAIIQTFLGFGITSPSDDCESTTGLMPRTGRRVRAEAARSAAAGSIRGGCGSGHWDRIRRRGSRAWAARRDG